MACDKSILMIGPDSQGGITSVIKSLLSSELSQDIEFIPSYVGGNIFKRLFYYAYFLHKYVLYLVLNPQIQIVHFQSSSRGSFIRKSIAMYIAKAFGKKVIFHYHSGGFERFYNDSHDIFKHFIERTLNDANLIILLANYWEEVISKYILNPNINILYNPVEIQNTRANNNQTPIFVCMGRIGENKGSYDILESCKKIRHRDFEIHLYGDGDVDLLRKFSAEFAIDDILKVQGWVNAEERHNVFQSADAVLLPSYSECLPMSVLEGMSYGLAVIASPVGGIPDAVEDGLNGYLIEPADITNLAQKIEILASNKILRDRMGEKSHRIAKEKFDIKIISAQLKEIYSQLMQ